MLNKALGLLILFVSTQVQASDLVCEAMTLKDKKVKICYSEIDKSWVDESCIKNPSCEARKFLSPIPSDKIKAIPAQVKNPCSDRCLNRAGEIQFGVNERGSSTSFCIAKDQSMIDCARLNQVE